MSDTKKQTDLEPVILNKDDTLKAGYGGRELLDDKRNRELDKPNKLYNNDNAKT